MLRPSVRSLRVMGSARRAFSSRSLIPNEPPKPEVHTDAVPGPASKACVSHLFRSVN